MATLYTVFHPICPAKFQRTKTISRRHIANPILLNPKPKSCFQIHASTNLQSNLIARSRKLVTAHPLFDEMFEYQILSQNFTSIEDVINERVIFNGHALNNLIDSCFDMGEVNFGLQMHSLCIRTGFVLKSCMRISLITMYLRHGLVDYASKVINQTSVLILGDSSFWDSIISELVLHQCYDEAFRVFGEMVCCCLVEPTERVYVRIISVCSGPRGEKYGKVIHGRIIKEGFEEATHVFNSLIKFYTKCSNLDDARKVFERIYKKDVVSWNTIIASCEQNGKEVLAIEYFCRMVSGKLPLQPNRITFLSALSAVSGFLALNLGREIHAFIFKVGLDVDTSLANCLITMYSKCKKVDRARIIFESMIDKDLITWNSMLSGYEQNQQPENCFKLFHKMQVFGFEPDSHSYTTLLAAASLGPSIRRGIAIHAYILRKYASNEFNLSVSNALLGMYAGFTQMENAEKIFIGMKKKDLYSWNTIMDGYSTNGEFDEVFVIFSNMLSEGLPCNHWTFSILLTCCGRLVSLQLGKQIHSVVIKLFCIPNPPSIDSIMAVNNSLISMYSKCSNISDATQVFHGMKNRDVFSWTAMITGYAYHGMSFESIELYERMKVNGVKPNHVTFLGLLLACVHGSLVENGVVFFNSMTKDYGLSPSIEHYACMIDLFARSGQFDKAKMLVESGISIYGNIPKFWKVLLGACHAQNQVKLGIEIAKRVLELDPLDESTLIILANLYAALGSWGDALRIRGMMRSKGLKKEVGHSWLEVGKKKHNFVAGDIFHPQRKEIYEKLSELDCMIQRVGYLPMTRFVLHDVDETQKEEIVRCHSEKLAVTFGILQSRKGSKGAIRVIKNLRVCGDCHNWMKCVSKVEGREIILRDSRRFHHFRNGSCSCREFW